MSTSEGLLTSGEPQQTQTQPNTSDSEQSQSTQPSEKPTSPLTQAEKLAKIDDLLNKSSDPQLGVSQLPNEGNEDHGPAAQSATADEASRPTHEESGGAMTVKELAEKLQTSPKKLYESLEIGLGDGETVTLSEMKSQYKAQQAATREIVERENQLSVQQAQTLENLQLLNSVYDDLKGKLSPQTLQKLQEKTRGDEAKERGLMVQAMPELSDPVKLDTFRTDVAETMAQFGFKSHELVIRDHRIALAINELIKTKRQLKALMEFEPNANPPRASKPQGKRAKPNRTAQIIKQARGGSKQDKAAAANAILRGAKNA